MTKAMSRRKLPRLNVDPARAKNLSFEIPESALARWNAGLRAKDGDNSISIYDPIGSDFFGDGVTAKRIAAALRTLDGEDIVVNINSPGGDVFEGIAIYNLLRDHDGEVTVRVLGAAMSAASVIAMAGDRIEIGRAASMMVHNIWMIAVGNRNDLREAADTLEPLDEALASVYAARTGLKKAEVAKLMDKESWFTGEQAITDGFADALLPADQVEETDGAPDTKAALRRVDGVLAKSGLPRSERRALLRQLTGTPSAAGDATPSAGGEGDGSQVVQRLTELVNSEARRYNPFIY